MRGSCRRLSPPPYRKTVRVTQRLRKPATCNPSPASQRRACPADVSRPSLPVGRCTRACFLSDIRVAALDRRVTHHVQSLHTRCCIRCFHCCPLLSSLCLCFPAHQTPLLGCRCHHRWYRSILHAPSHITLHYSPSSPGGAVFAASSVASAAPAPSSPPPPPPPPRK
jgi:hypothetical protein